MPIFHIHSAETQEMIMHALLRYIPTQGWTVQALKNAVADCGGDEADHYRAFDGQPLQAMDFFFNWINQEMLKGMNKVTAQRVPDRIKETILIRLEILQPYRPVIRSTLAFLARPQHVPRGIRYLYNTVDAIWYAIGDTSTDFNFYTKRLTLAAVYSSTLLKWATDQSVNNHATHHFLDRQINNIMLIPKIKKCFRALL